MEKIKVVSKKKEKYWRSDHNCQECGEKAVFLIIGSWDECHYCGNEIALCEEHAIRFAQSILEEVQTNGR